MCYGAQGTGLHTVCAMVHEGPVCAMACEGQACTPVCAVAAEGPVCVPWRLRELR